MPAADPIDAVPMSDALRALARRGVAKPIRKGTLLILEGDVGGTLFIVVSGRLRAFGAGARGREVTYSEYGPGEYVGEMSLDGGPRSASVECVQAGTVVMVTRPTLEAYLRDNPAFAFELLAKVIRRARAATLGFKQIATNDVYGRLKVLFDEMAPRDGSGTPRVLDPAPSHQEIADRLGCHKSMVTKLLADLVKGGVVQAGRRRLVVLRDLPDKW
jgi:CRP/FNR family cyclic AMP-dependent transcriptional regulator